MINKNLSLVHLETNFEKNLTDIPWSEYPRPQLRRDSYLCLNGKWDFKIENRGKAVFSGEILVPFAPEARISGVQKEIRKDDTLIYERKFALEENFVKDKVLLHFGACDQYAKVFVNGILAGENVGGYLPFTFNITELLRSGENIIKVEARDPLNLNLPYGKQTNKRGGMWYTKISGIWQTVWLESVPVNYIEAIKITTDLKGACLKITGGNDAKTLYFEGEKYTFTGDSFRIDVKKPHLWTANDPYLYEFTLSSGEDTVSSYFGLRTVCIGEKNGKSYILLNDEPVFFHGLLDQGYFSDGIFLPATVDGFKEDILKMKSCGFNMLRKHIKLEPDLFYYYCDKYGMFVFQDMINSGKYNFLIDTALPTIGLKRGITHKANAEQKENFEKTGRGIIESLYNHPSVVYYTIFNEGWGQFNADKYYEIFKTLDSTRVYDTTSGWFKTILSDVESDHIYFKPVKLKAKNGRPMVLTEFGGYSCKVKNHSFNLDKTYGYRYYNRVGFFENAITALYKKEIIPAIKNGLCATVLTQVSDVEDETNGLLTYDRKVLKVDSAKMKALSEKIYKIFKQTI